MENDRQTPAAEAVACVSCEAAGQRIPRGKYPTEPVLWAIGDPHASTDSAGQRHPLRRTVLIKKCINRRPVVFPTRGGALEQDDLRTLVLDDGFTQR